MFKESAAAISTIGLLMTAALAAPTATATQIQPETMTAPPASTTWDAVWTRTWRNGTIRNDGANPDAIQGTAVGGKNVAQIGFPLYYLHQQLLHMQATDPTTRISKVQVRLHASHWWFNSGGAADIGVHGSLMPPAKFKYSGSLTVSSWGRNTTRTIDLPRTWLPGFNSGTTYGITLGGKAQASTNPIFYGRFAGDETPRSARRPQLLVTFSTG